MIKISKSLIGKSCRIRWRDPYRFSTDNEIEFRTQLEGWNSMPVWTEYGVIDNITDDVVRVIISQAENSKREWHGFVVPAVLIEDITILEQKNGEGAALSGNLITTTKST